MKQFAALASLLVIFACSKEQPEGNVHISGVVDGLKQGTLIIRNDENTQTIDSIVIKGDSNFESHFTLESPQLLHIYLNRGVTTSIDNSLDVFVEPGDLRIETTLDRFYADAKITGSKGHELLQEYKKGNQRYTDQQLELMEKRLTAFKNKTAFDEVSAVEEANKIEARRYLHAINFAINHKDNHIAPFIGLSVRDANLKLLDTLMGSLTPDVAEGKYGKMLKDLIEQRKKAGQ